MTGVVKRIPAAEHAGMVYWGEEYAPPGMFSNDEGDEQYYESVEALIKACRSYDVELPDEVHGVVGFSIELDAKFIVDDALMADSHCDSAIDNIVDIEGLQKVLDEWVAKQPKNLTYRCDEALIVVLKEVAK